MNTPAAPRREAPARPIRILLVDDHDLLRAGVRGLLQNKADLEVVGEAQDGRQGLSQALQLQPQVVITDLGMPGMGGLELTALLATQCPAIRVLVLSMRNEPAAVEAMRAAGACGFLDKGASSPRLIAAIRACMAEPARAWVT